MSDGLCQPPIEGAGPLQLSTEDVTQEVAAHVQKVHGGRARRVRMKSMSGGEKVMHWVAGSKEEVEEVGDDWFGEQERRGIVRLTISKNKERIGRYVGGGRKSTTEEGKQIVQEAKKRRNKGKTAANTGTIPPLVVVEEEEGHSDGELRPGPATLLAPSPVYSDLSFVESPTGSVETFEESDLSRTNTTTTFDESRPETPSNVLLSLPPTQGIYPTYTQSSTNSSSPADDRLFNPPSRTLTLDESLPRSKRRDSRSDFSKRGHFRPRKFQKVVQKRLKTLARGGLQAEADEQLNAALIDAGVVQEEKEQYVYDVLYEHQRGLVVFGTPMFSSAALTQFDPASWTDSSLRNSPFTPDDHPLPTPAWTWDHPFWFVDMSADVDECGWSYAVRFRSGHWRGEADGWRSFARRRRWIRGRVLKPIKLPRPVELGGSEVDWEALRNSEFSDRATPDDGGAVDQDEESGPLPERGTGIVGLKAATALLPLTHESKNDIFSWEGQLDPQDPFLAYSYVKMEGDRLHPRRKSSHAFSSQSDETLGQWRSAVIEINYRRTARVLRQCRIDREKLGLWRYWLGLKATVETSGNDELELYEQLLDSKDRVQSEVDPSTWANDEKSPAADDVWDLLEGRLDQILLLFEFQISRLYLLHLILSLHPVTHLHHHWQGYDRDEPFEPGVLSPKLVSSRLGRRIDFYRDVQELEKYYVGQAEGRISIAVTPNLEEREGWKGKGKETIPL